VELAEYQLILLRAPAAAPEYAEAEENRIQREHLAFYEAQRAAGHVVTNGPVRDQPDPTLRGLAILAVGSLARAAELARTDPAVLAGVLEVEAMNWWCRPGTMIAPGRALAIPDPA
jgi:uncharacterized protein YciI